MLRRSVYLCVTVLTICGCDALLTSKTDKSRRESDLVVGISRVEGFSKLTFSPEADFFAPGQGKTPERGVQLDNRVCEFNQKPPVESKDPICVEE